MASVTSCNFDSEATEDDGSCATTATWPPMTTAAVTSRAAADARFRPPATTTRMPLTKTTVLATSPAASDVRMKPALNYNRSRRRTTEAASSTTSLKRHVPRTTTSRDVLIRGSSASPTSMALVSSCSIRERLPRLRRSALIPSEKAVPRSTARSRSGLRVHSVHAPSGRAAFLTLG